MEQNYLWGEKSIQINAYMTEPIDLAALRLDSPDFFTPFQSFCFSFFNRLSK